MKSAMCMKEEELLKDAEIIELFLKRSENAIHETARKYGAYCHTIAWNIPVRRRWYAAAVAALVVVISIAGSAAVRFQNGGGTAESPDTQEEGGLFDSVDDTLGGGLSDSVDTKTGGGFEGSLDTGIGEKDSAGTKLTAEEIAEVDIDCAGLEALEKEIRENADYDEIKPSVDLWISDGAEGFLLTDTTELAVSDFNMPMIKLSDLSVAEVVYEFLFSEEHPVGYIEFFMGNGKLGHNISLFTPETHGYYLDFLADHSDESFLILTDGISSYFLSEDNVLYRASSKTVTTEIAIDDDSYHAFPDELTVSYEKITSQVMVIGEE